MRKRILIIFTLFLLSNLMLAQENNNSLEIVSNIKADSIQVNTQIDSIRNYYNIKIDSIKQNERIKTDSVVKVKIDSIKKVHKIKDENSEKLPSKYWKIEGKNSLTLNQNSFTNWVAGGNNSFGINGKMDYKFNYKKKNALWENRVKLGYGQLSNEKEKPKKTDDILSFASTYGRKVKENWYTTVSFSLLTQIAEGFDYGDTPDYTSKDRISNFMSPGYLTFGLGMDYKHSDNLSLTFKPSTLKTTLILDKKLRKKGDFGLESDGDWAYLELGALFGVNYKKEIIKNIIWDNSLTLFSNYLKHPERIAVNYNSTINMKINSFISTILAIDLVYDHDVVQKTQLKQSFGVGFAYSFDTIKK